MAQLDFSEIARLLNYSRTTQINLTQTRGTSGRWALHQGWHKVHTSNYPFTVLYIYAAASLDDIRMAASELTEGTDTHVVYPPSLDRLIKRPEVTNLLKRAKGTWTTKDYLITFINDELQTYRQKVDAQSPKFYIDPRVETPAGFPIKTPNPLLSFLTDPDSASLTFSGKLAILLAEPGQGKTYMSRHLVSRLSQPSRGILPLMVDASQWQSLSIDDQKSLPKTIAHSFRHFDATIGWIEGHEEEFLQTTLKADLFRIVFDGFDEYILRNRGTVQAMEVIEVLADLANSTGTRIVITSRTSFWHTNISDSQRNDFLTRTGSLEYTIEPFDVEQAKNYFAGRLRNERQKNSAFQVYEALRKDHKKLVGRGFVLNLIADLAERAMHGSEPSPVPTNALLWLIDSLCERELLRQELPFTARDQVDLLRTFAVETAEGTAPNTELLELAMADVKPVLDPDSLRSAVEKFRSHPLLEKAKNADQWFFKQEQIEIVLLADQILKWQSGRIVQFFKRSKLDAAVRQDLSEALVDIERGQFSANEAISKLRDLCRTLSGLTGDSIVAPDDGPRFAAAVALMTVDRFLPKGSSHQERAILLQRVSGRESIEGFTFTGTIARYDFSHIAFENCRFEHVTWANCQFAESTIFRRCHFAGGLPPIHCERFGSVQLIDCRLDPDADAIFNSARVKEGKKKYAVDDLQNDIRSVLSKFVIKGGIGLKSVTEPNLNKGPISVSRHQDEILNTLRGLVLESHSIAGGPKSYRIRDDSHDAIKFYAANNVFTGPIREAFDRLRSKLALS